jgi:alpha,alpha-trehalase
MLLPPPVSATLGTLLGVFKGAIPFDGTMNDERSSEPRAASMRVARFNFGPYEAVLSDLDGVITQTARIHAAAWQQLFDDYLAALTARTGATFRPFDLEDDYRLHLDGKPRQDGVRDFLASRGLSLPLGSPDDGADLETLYGMGNKKDTYFKAAMRETGVEVYPATVDFLRLAKRAGLKIAVVSSSHHCADILEAVRLTSLFDIRVDGHEIDRLRLHGKPAPDSFLEAARRVGVRPQRAIVIEDALAGVQAGHAGGFGCVIGVDRRNQAQALHELGANIVVSDLAELLQDRPELSSPRSR